MTDTPYSRRLLHENAAGYIVENCMNIILMGMKHCGKSSAGRLLACNLGRPFFDLDELVIDRYEKEYLQRKTIEEIFRMEDAGVFYRWEAHTFKQFCTASASDNGDFVLALGGRTPLNPLLGESLTQCGILIYIKTPFERILERVMKTGTSTLFRRPDPASALKEIYDARHPVYLEKAHLVVDGDGDIEEVAMRLTRQIKEHHHVR